MIFSSVGLVKPQLLAWNWGVFVGPPGPHTLWLFYLLITFLHVCYQGGVPYLCHIIEHIFSHIVRFRTS